MVFLLVPFMIVPALAMNHEAAVRRLLATLTHLPPYVVVVELVLGLVLVNWALLALGAAKFDRERILTKM